MGKAKSHIFIQFIHCIIYLFKLKKDFLKILFKQKGKHMTSHKRGNQYSILNTQIIQFYSPPAWICIYIFY